MNFIDLAKPIEIPAGQLPQLLAKILAGNANEPAPGEVYFPARGYLSAILRVSELATDWERPLPGMRIADLRSTGLRLLERSSVPPFKVEHSQPLKGGDFEAILDAFFERVQALIAHVDLALGCGVLRDRIYSAESCALLLKASFRDEVRPRLIPRFAWPSKGECALALRESIGPLPWRREDYNGRVVLERSGAQLKLEVYGERGELEQSAASADEDEIYRAAFRFFTRHDFFEDDGALSFSHAGLPRR